MLKTSIIGRENYFTHIGFQKMEIKDDFCPLMRAFDKKCKCMQPGKDTCFCLYHLKKIKCVEVVDPGKIKYLHEDQVIFHRSDADIIDSCEDEYISDHFQEGSLTTGCNSKRSTRFLETGKSLEGMGGLVEEFFTTTLSDSSNDETCRIYVSCDCILQQESTYKQR